MAGIGNSYRSIPVGQCGKKIDQGTHPLIFGRDKLATDIRRLLGVHATIPTKTTFAHRLSRLRGRVRRFQQESLKVIGVDEEKDVVLRFAGEDLAQTNLDLDDEGWGQLIDVELTSDTESPEVQDTIEDDEDGDDEQPLENEVRPDRSILLMPSAISPLVISRLNISQLVEVELESRKGQANDILEGLMLALCT